MWVDWEGRRWCCVEQQERDPLRSAMKHHRKERKMRTKCSRRKKKGVENRSLNRLQKIRRWIALGPGGECGASGERTGCGSLSKDHGRPWQKKERREKLQLLILMAGRASVFTMCRREAFLCVGATFELAQGWGLFDPSALLPPLLPARVKISPDLLSFSVPF